jgi:hypothetical protein
VVEAVKCRTINHIHAIAYQDMRLSHTSELLWPFVALLACNGFDSHAPLLYEARFRRALG